MVGVNGRKFPAIREHLAQNIAKVYKDMDVTFDEFPKGGHVDPDACKPVDLTTFNGIHSVQDKLAIDQMSPGDAIIVFTPDRKW